MTNKEYDQLETCFNKNWKLVENTDKLASRSIFAESKVSTFGLMKIFIISITLVLIAQVSVICSTTQNVTQYVDLHSSEPVPNSSFLSNSEVKQQKGTEIRNPGGQSEIIAVNAPNKIKKINTNVELQSTKKNLNIVGDLKSVPSDTNPPSRRPKIEVEAPGPKINDLGEMNKDEVFQVVEQQAEFPGGGAALFKWLRENIKYPEAASLNKIEGKVIMLFVVEKDGSISGITVRRSANEDFDNEAIRVLKAMPKWTPGKQRGVDVRSYFTLPVVFKL